MPSFSLIIPAYNMERFLPDTLASVAKQTCRDFETIVVDDGSADGTAAAAARFAAEVPGLRVVRQENLGLGGARNTGIAHAAGDFLWFIDADDTIAPDALQKIADCFAKTNADAVFFDIAETAPDGRTLQVTPGCHAGAPRVFSFAEAPALVAAPVNAVNKIFRRSLFETTGVRFPEHAYYEDLATVPKLYPRAGRIAYLNEALYNYVQRPGSIMHSAAGQEKRIRDMAAALDSVREACRAAGQWAQFGDAVDFLTVFHALYLQSVRLLKAGADNAALQALYRYVKENVPNPAQTPYFTLLTPAQRAVCQLLLKRQYAPLRLLFHIKK